jgi:hypothetical protein
LNGLVKLLVATALVGLFFDNDSHGCVIYKELLKFSIVSLEVLVDHFYDLFSLKALISIHFEAAAKYLPKRRTLDPFLEKLAQVHMTVKLHIHYIVFSLIWIPSIKGIFFGKNKVYAASKTPYVNSIRKMVVFQN